MPAFFFFFFFFRKRLPLPLKLSDSASPRARLSTRGTHPVPCLSQRRDSRLAKLQGGRHEEHLQARSGGIRARRKSTHCRSSITNCCFAPLIGAAAGGEHSSTLARGSGVNSCFYAQKGCLMCQRKRRGGRLVLRLFDSFFGSGVSSEPQREISCGRLFFLRSIFSPASRFSVNHFPTPLRSERRE